MSMASGDQIDAVLIGKPRSKGCRKREFQSSPFGDDRRGKGKTNSFVLGPENDDVVGDGDDKNDDNELKHVFEIYHKN